MLYILQKVSLPAIVHQLPLSLSASTDTLPARSRSVSSPSAAIARPFFLILLPHFLLNPIHSPSLLYHSCPPTSPASPSINTNTCTDTHTRTRTALPSLDGIALKPISSIPSSFALPLPSRTTYYLLPRPRPSPSRVRTCGAD